MIRDMHFNKEDCAFPYHGSRRYKFRGYFQNSYFLNTHSNKIMEYAAGQYDDPRFQLGKYEWPALLRLLEKNHSIYKQ